MCGNWNNRTDDDILDRKGLLDAANFADSWKTEPRCAAANFRMTTNDMCEANVSYDVQSEKLSIDTY